MARCGRILFSENATPRKQRKGLTKKLRDGFEGIYELEDGSIMEAHEWEDSDWDEEPNPPLGAVYYDIYENGEVVDGGVMGYDEGDRIADLDTFMRGSNQPGIARLVAAGGTDEYEEIYGVLGDPESYAPVKRKYGFSKNRRSRRGRR